MIDLRYDSSIDEVQAWLKKKQWLMHREEVTSMGKAGEGNMNIVLRVTTDQRSFILKQSKKFVAKYPQIPAPIDRIAAEVNFYQSIQTSSASAYFPKLYHYAETDHLIMLQDLGEGEDLTVLYARGSGMDLLLPRLVKIMSEIHSLPLPHNYPENIALRKLNHAHLFHLPFVDNNGFDLESIQQGLGTLAREYLQKKRLVKRISRLGEWYLSSGDTIVHGDYYPGSWMQVEDKVYILDPEFTFPGFKELDLGVMMAHLSLIKNHSFTIPELFVTYPHEFDHQKVYHMAGVEMMRRLIGIAQLPLERTIPEKQELMKMAEDYLCT